MIYDTLKDVRTSKLKELITEAAVIEPSYTISKVVNTILQKNSYDVFCTRNGSILSTNVRELLLAKDITRMKAFSVLSKIKPLSPEDSVEKAATIMSHYRIRSVPVAENGTLLGVVEAKNMLQLLSDKDLRWIKANIAFTTNPITINSVDPLSKARKLMVSKRIDHLPVIQKGKVRQVLTSPHLLQLLNPHEKISRHAMGTDKIKRFESQVGNLGSRRVPQCRTNDNLNVVIKAMLQSDTSCCLITLWDNLHGIITYKDLFQLLELKIPSDVPAYVVGMPLDHENSNIVKQKFTNIIKKIKKIYPEIEEARATIKQHHAKGQRQFYEVTVNIHSPYRIFNYSEVGWNFSQVFDYLGRKILRNLSKRRKTRWKTSIRKREVKFF